MPYNAIMSLSTPTPTLATHHTRHRQNIARIVSSLRPVRPHTPFYRLAAHRVPTLWALYRGLLRASPSPIVRSHVQALFREHRHLTSPTLTKIQLEKGQRWLGIFRKAEQGDEHLRAILQRFGGLIGARRDHIRMRSIVDESISWQHRLLNRPIFSASLLKPSLSNGPLPRLKPQPDHISGMIRKRRVARARRIELQRVLLSHLEDLRAEAEFETSLAAATRTNGAGLPLEEWRCFSEPHLAAWCAPLTSRLEQLQTSFELDAQRAARPPPAELLLQLQAARREKIANKTRERAREARGEVLTATRRRARLGFPAHVLARWTPAVRKAKLLARRCVGEVGYVGIVKRALGYGVRSLEEEDRVDEATRERLDRLTEEVRRVSQSRRDKEERIAEGSVLGPRKAGAA